MTSVRSRGPPHNNTRTCNRQKGDIIDASDKKTHNSKHGRTNTGMTSVYKQNRRSGKGISTNSIRYSIVSSCEELPRNTWEKDETESWRQHFKKIQNGTTPVAQRVWHSITDFPQSRSGTTRGHTHGHGNHQSNTQHEDRQGTRRRRSDVEMLKWAPKDFLDRVIAMIQDIRQHTLASEDFAEADTWRQEWLIAIVIPLWKKKQPKSNKGNWRGVTLLSVGVKIIARIAASRLQELSTQFMDEEQQAFGVDDVLQVSRRVAEEVCFATSGDSIVLTLYDIEKAYPRVNREALWILLEKRGAPRGFICILRALHDHNHFHVKMSGSISRPYTADRGLKEGCPSSPPLFNIYHQAVLQDFRQRRKRRAEQAGLSTGIQWKIKIDDRRSRGAIERRSIRQVRYIRLGDLEFADDTATFAHAPGRNLYGLEREIESRQNRNARTYPRSHTGNQQQK